MATIESMTNVETILKVMQNQSPEARALVQKAADFARKAHGDQKRLSGEDYMVHPEIVACRLAELGLDEHTLAAALLHDTLEDTKVTKQELEQEFGSEIVQLVDGVTKLGDLKYRGSKPHVESLRRLFVATASDIRVILIKLYDRLHNMETLEHHDPDRRKRKALETLEVYAPIAERLGMGKLKVQLEDLAFPYIDPEAYEKTRKLRKSKREEDEERLKRIHKSLKKALAEHNIVDFTSEIRIKGLYSLYQKLERKDGDFERIKDISAIRIIVPTESDCYRVLGIVHGMWRPLPGKIKDYIAFEKPNGYQSLHTTVFTGDGGLVEIQIRTREMHRHAEYGIASHFVYKQQGSQAKPSRWQVPWIQDLIPGLLKVKKQKEGIPEPETKKTNKKKVKSSTQWIHELADVQGDIAKQQEFLESLKRDFFSHRIFVFTPRGDVMDLPVDSSPIDFAYAIHSDIGDHIHSAKVNGKMASLGTQLENGDIVEIETKDSAHPTRKWLEHARTSLAKRRIRSYIGHEYTK